MARFARAVDQPYISQFAPEDLGFQQNFFDNLQANQNSYRTNIGSLNKEIAVLPNDTPSIIEGKKQVEAKLEQLRGINFNDPRQQQAALKEVSGIRNLFSPQGLFGAAEEKRKKYEKEVEEINKGNNDFKKALRLQQLQSSNLAPEAAVRLDSYGRPINTQVVVPEDFEYKDKTKVFSELLEDVMADTRSVNSGLTQEKAAEALLKYTNGQIEERTGEKIYNSIKQRALADPNLMKSIQAEAFVNKIEDPNQLFEAALRGVAQSGAYKKSNVDVKYQNDDLAEYRAKKQDEIKDANITTSSQSEALPGSLVTIPKEIEDLQFTASGDLKPITRTTYRDVMGSRFASSLTGGQPTFAPTGKQGFDEEANQRAVQLVSNLQAQNPELKGLKPKQVIEAYKSSLKALEQESIPLNSISNVAAKNIGDALSRNKAQRNFYLFDAKGKTSDGQLETVLEELDIKEEDLNKALERGISGYTQAGPSAGGYYVEVPDSKGKSRRVVISADNEMNKIFRPSQLINEARKSLTPTEIKPFEERPDYSIIVQPNITKSGTPTWKYVEVIKDQEGNIIQQNETSLDDLREAERRRLANSNYLGSQVDVMKPNTAE